MYNNLESCLKDLERNNQVIYIEEEIDPYLLASEIQRQIYKQKGPAIYFKNIKGSKYPAVCNLFGTFERTSYIFRKSYTHTKELMRLAVQKKTSTKTLKSLLHIKNTLIKKQKISS